MQPTPEGTPAPPITPEAQPVTAQTAHLPEAKKLGTDAAKMRVSVDRRVVDAGNTSAIDKKAAEEQVYEEIFREQQTAIEAALEADPVMIDARANGWSPEAEKNALLDPGDRVGAKSLSEAGARVNEARQRHAVAKWGKFAQENPQTAQKYAEQNPDVRHFIDTYKVQKLAEARIFVDRAYQRLKSLDPEYIAAQQLGGKIGAAEAQLRPALEAKAFDELVEADPDATRFLLDYGDEPGLAEIPKIKAAYERYFVRQETRKAEIATETARIAQEKGAEEALKALASDEAKKKRSEAAKKGAATKAANKEAAKRRAEQEDPRNIPIGPDGKPMTWDEVDIALGFKPPKQENLPIGPDGKPISWDEAARVLGYGAGADGSKPGIAPAEVQPAAAAKTPEPPTTVRPDAGRRIEPKIINGVAYHPDHLPDAHSRPDGTIEFRGGVKFIGEAPTPIDSRREKPQAPASERSLQVAVTIANLERNLLTAKDRKLSKPQIEALSKKLQEAKSAFFALQNEVATEGIIANVSSEQNLEKRATTAKSIVANERDPKKRLNLLNAFIAAGVLIAGTTFVGASEARRVA